MPAEEILTTRGFFEWQTSIPTCAGCHNQINPAGFAFEAFDAIGAHRSTENGAAIDASGALTIGTTDLSFTRGAEFLDQLANVGETRACYARNWYRYLSGREEVSGDLRTLGRLTQAMSDPAFGVRDLLLQVAQSTPFTHLPPI